jgi:hypothetical protein
MKTTCAVIALFFTLAPLSFAADEKINENDLFSSPDLAAQTKVMPNAASSEDKRSVGFSGQMTSAFSDFVYASSTTPDSLYSLTVANLFLDARLPNSVKGFANVEVDYLSQTKATSVFLRELFFDFVMEKHVYVRTGKQVLQWGPCYFWNPTDLINIEQKPFIRKIGYREGAYGAKIHIPFGTKLNLYGFIDTGSAGSAQDVAGAFKIEFLAGKTEMAFSTWLKRTYNPVAGYDFTTRVFGIDTAGEASVSRGDIQQRLIEDQGVLSLGRRTDETLTKAALSFTKPFDLGNFHDRVSVTTEFFYNGAGYDGNAFADKRVFAFGSPFAAVNAAGVPSLIASGTKRDFLLGQNLYSPNYYSLYYAAAFVTVNRFIISDMVFTANYMRNLCDSSGIVSAGVTYTTLNDFNAGLLINEYVGNPDSEYTFSAITTNVQLTFGISF